MVIVCGPMTDDITPVNSPEPVDQNADAASNQTEGYEAAISQLAGFSWRETLEDDSSASSIMEFEPGINNPLDARGRQNLTDNAAVTATPAQVMPAQVNTANRSTAGALIPWPRQHTRSHENEATFNRLASQTWRNPQEETTGTPSRSIHFID